MEYTRLPKLTNTYPTFVNYKANGIGKVQLFGIYPEKNKIDFNLPSIDNLNFVSNTNFRFILAIFKTYNDSSPVYYTSDSYYKDLEASTIENNPYFLQNSFKNENIVSFVCEDAIKIYKNLTPLENKSFVNIRQSLFIKGTGDIDYDNLVRYIDWFVDKPSPLDDANLGVLKSEMIAGWDILNGNYATGKLTTGVSGSFGIGAQLIIPTDIVNTMDAEGALKLEKDNRDKIYNEITQLETALKTETGFQYDRGTFGFLGLGWAKAYTTINDKLYQTNSTLTINKSEKTNQLKSLITTDINAKYIDKKSAESAVANAESTLNDLMKKSDELKNKVSDLKNQANDLLGKIPAIPKIPPIPKIPKLPKSLSELKGLLPELPLIPALPNLPALPKIPSLKFPPLPKFKPKTPKEPKKFKKGKGLKGLKDAAGDLQNASTSVISQAQGLANKANGLASAVQNAVAGAISTVTSTANLLLVQATSVGTSAQSNIKSSANLSNIVGSSGQNSTDDANLGGLSQADIVAQKEAQIQSGTRYAKKLQDGTIRYIYNDPSSPTGYVYGDGTIVNKDD